MILRMSLVTCCMSLALALCLATGAFGSEKGTQKQLLSTATRRINNGICATDSCNKCFSDCPSTAEASAEKARCSQVRRLTKLTPPEKAYFTCIKEDCKPILYSHACGLFDVDSRRDVLRQVRDEEKRTLANANAVAREADQFYRANLQNEALVKYYNDSLSKIEECRTLFRRALGARARNVKLTEYVQSVEYRRVKQEVTRLKYETDDFRRQVKFWERQYEALSLAVRTSPRGLKDARDALHAEMKTYEADAQLMMVLRETTLTKEKRAQLIIRLREQVRAELDNARSRNAHVVREQRFMREARKEIYKMLRSVWRKLKQGQLNVRCGGSMLTDAVTEAIKSATVS